jgi:hypothetical protein
VIDKIFQNAENTSVISEDAFKIFSADVRDNTSAQSETQVLFTKITDYRNNIQYNLLNTILYNWATYAMGILLPRFTP